MKNPFHKMIIAVLFLAAGTVGLFLVLSQGETVVHNQRENLIVHKTLDKAVTVPVLDSINARNAQMKSFSCDLKAIAQTSGRRAVRLDGSLFYEKEKKFRVGMDSFLGPELDIGSDGNQFWFWSGRMKNPGLYWSTYDNFQKTKLKTPFNPIWLSHCLGIDQIDYSKSVIDKNDDNRWRVIVNSTNAKKEPIVTVTYVDPKKKLITGHGVYNQNGELEASSEIQEFNNNLPSKISFIWHKEKASMIWYIKNVKSNTKIDASKWVMPGITPKINMGLDS